MIPGRELDALIAEKVMGVCWATTPVSPIRGTVVVGTSGRTGMAPQKIFDGEAWDYQGIPHCSTDIKAAWEVVNEMYHRKFVLRLESPYSNVIPGHWKAMFGFKCVNPEAWENEINNHFAETAAHAICLAALRALK